MKKCEVTLYEIEGLNPSKNFKVEDIIAFLETNKISKKVIEDFQYQKIELDMSLCIKENQIDYNELEDLFSYNYLTIKDSVDDSRIYCFFITGYKWASDKSLTLDVHLDVLNSFNSQLYNYTTGEEDPFNDYVINENHSKLFRAFKDRCKIDTFTFHKTYTYNDFAYSGTYKAYVSIFSYGQHSNVSVTFHNAPVGVSWSATTFADGNGYRYNITVTAPSEFGTNFSMDVTFKAKRLQALIDIISEGITPPKYKTKEDIINDEDVSKWYLLYKNHDNSDPNTPEPFDVFLLSDTYYQAKDPTSAYISASDLTDDVLYSISPYSLNNLNNGFEDVIYYGNSYATSVQARISYSQINEGYYTRYRSYGIFFKKNGTTIDVFGGIFTKSYITETMTFSHQTMTQVFSANVDHLYYWKNATLRAFGKNNGVFSVNSTYDEFDLTQNFVFAMSSIIHNLKNVNEIDKTDSRVIKLIALPYKPVDIDIDGHYILCNKNVEYDDTEKLIKLTNFNAELRHQFEGFDYKFQDKILIPIKIQTNGYPYFYASAYSFNDTKLLHSDFEEHKIIYDTFNIALNLEEYDLSHLYGSNNDIYDKQNYNILKSKNVNSNFIVSFDIPQRYSQNNYDNILIANRNNEMTLYSNQYLNYLRTGYNFDVKAKNRAQIGAVLSAGNSVLGTIGSIVTGNPLGAIYSTSNTINAVMGAMQAEDSLNAKVKSAQYQATNVLNNDDVDILEEYSLNKLKYVEYEAEQQMQESLNELFRLYGYACVGTFKSNRINYKTREVFDYIQADIVIDSFKQMKKEWLDEIVEKYKEGITIFHKIKSANSWDLSQNSFQNWEVSLYIPLS